MRRSIWSVMLVGALAWFGEGLTAAGQDVTALFEKTGVKGGLCLVVGAKDTRLAEELAGNSALYIQVLQPDAKLALQWGLAVATSTNRESMGIRNAAFEPDHYGSDIFNLIVVDDAAALGKAKVSDLKRILAPDGVVAFKGVPASAADEAKTLGMSVLSVGAYAGVYRKPVTPFEWKPCDSLKWRAGMRAHMSTGICGPTHGSGRFYYREFLEPKDDWPNDTTHLVARDAYNGRVLWIKEEGAGRKQWGANQFSGWNWTLGADEGGRLFAVTKEGKLVCLDGATGEPRFELLSSGAKPGYVKTHLNKYVLYGNTVFLAETGKPLWKWKFPCMALNGETLVESDGATLWIRNLGDGKELVKVSLDWRGDRIKKGMGIHHWGSHIIITEGGRFDRPNVVTALDAATGVKLWSHPFDGLFGLPVKGEKGDKVFTGELRYTRMGDKLLAFCHTPYYFDRPEDQKEVHFTSIDLATGNVVKEDYGPKAKLFGNACATERALPLGDYLFYHHNVWLNYKTMERMFPYLVHPGCFLQPSAAYGMIYNSPGRKGGSIQGMTAIGPADFKFDQEPGGKVFQRYAARPAFGEATKAGDWPTFRANNSRGNATGSELGSHLAKVWEVKVGLGGKPYGQMYAERTGLSQAVIAYDTAFVADIDAQRIVALDVKDGRQKWVYPVGSRVDFPPTLYKGLCLFASKDGFVHCIDAKTGQPVYRLLVAPRERYIGGQEKLESLWPTAADVMVDNEGIGHASAGFASTIHGGNRVVLFKVETGEVVESKVNFEEFKESGYPGPKNGTTIMTERLAGKWSLNSSPMDDMLGYGNSISRNNEDRAMEQFSDAPWYRHTTSGRAAGRPIAFDEKLCVAHFLPYGAQSWAISLPMSLVASDKGPKAPLWKVDNIELIADDIVLTPSLAFVVGHYRRIKGESEIWTLTRADGKVINKTPVGGFPTYMGASTAGGRLYVSTREGKLICFQGASGSR